MWNVRRLGDTNDEAFTPLRDGDGRPGAICGRLKRADSLGDPRAFGEFDVVDGVDDPRPRDIGGHGMGECPPAADGLAARGGDGVY